MATSRSDDQKDDRKKEEWTATALIYSGRRDPSWAVPRRVVAKLLKTWDELASSSVALPHPAPLGYRGVELRATDGREWLAFGEIVSFRSGGRSEIRSDGSRDFERTILDSAPQGMLPMGFGI